MRRRVSVSGSIFLASMIVAARPCQAQTPDGTLYFNDATDSILIAGQTEFATTTTYEAWTYFPAGNSANGRLYNEWTWGAEDKVLAVGPSSVFGFNWPTTGATLLRYNGEATLDEWHHFAFVHDGGAGQQRLYVNGAIVASQAAGAQIGNGSGFGNIGAIFRDNSIVTTFRGFIDSVRLSDVVRYSGDSFTPPDRELPADADSVLVYHFEADEFFEEEGAVRVLDLSGNERHGTLAASFSEATSPAVPAIQGDLDCDGRISATDALKDLKASVGAPITQDEPCPDLGESLTTGLFGDVDCSGSLGASDALKILRFSVGLEVEQSESCPAFLDPV